MDFMAPIPGQSLTVEPGSVPWEQPPQYASVEEALGFYLEMFDDEDVLDDLMFMPQADLSLEAIVDFITSASVMNGKHTLDVKVLIAPVIHEYLKTLFDAAQVEYTEFEGPTKEEARKTKEKDRVKFMVAKSLMGTPDPSQENVAEAKEKMLGEAPVEQSPAPSNGLVPRRGV